MRDRGGEKGHHYLFCAHLLFLWRNIENKGAKKAWCLRRGDCRTFWWCCCCCCTHCWNRSTSVKQRKQTRTIVVVVVANTVLCLLIILSTHRKRTFFKENSRKIKLKTELFPPNWAVQWEMLTIRDISTVLKLTAFLLTHSVHQHHHHHHHLVSLTVLKIGHIKKWASYTRRESNSSSNNKNSAS